MGDPGKIATRQQELACGRGTERVRFDHLALPPRLVEIGIKHWANGVGIECAVALIVLQPKECAVVPAQVPIYSARDQRILTRSAAVHNEVIGTGRNGAKSIGADEAAAPQRIRRSARLR